MNRRRTLRTFIINSSIPSLHFSFRLGCISMQTIPFYGFLPKNIRFWDGNHMFLHRKPYGFETENVKVRLLQTGYLPFNPALIHSRPNKFIVFRSCFEFLQKVFLGLMYPFSCVLWAIFWSFSLQVEPVNNISSFGASLEFIMESIKKPVHTVVVLFVIGRYFLFLRKSSSLLLGTQFSADVAGYGCRAVSLFCPHCIFSVVRWLPCSSLLFPHR